MAILLVSERGMARREARSNVPAYSADLLRWAPIMENPGLYLSTPPVNLIVARGEAMKIILEEGLAMEDLWLTNCWPITLLGNTCDWTTCVWT